jgi:hypothetical protein
MQKRPGAYNAWTVMFTAVMALEETNSTLGHGRVGGWGGVEVGVLYRDRRHMLLPLRGVLVGGSIPYRPLQ